MKINFVLILLLLCSCSTYEKGIAVEIENNSTKAIANLQITTSERVAELKFDQLESGNILKDFLPMVKNKTDGHYLVEFTRADGKKESTPAGYYTNGGSLERTMHIHIQKDTTIITFRGILF